MAKRKRPRVFSTLAPATVKMADFLKPQFRNSRSRVIDEAVRRLYEVYGRR